MDESFTLWGVNNGRQWASKFAVEKVISINANVLCSSTVHEINFQAGTFGGSEGAITYGEGNNEITVRIIRSLTFRV